jgi:hypothetical protein
MSLAFDAAGRIFGFWCVKVLEHAIRQGSKMPPLNW